MATTPHPVTPAEYDYYCKLVDALNVAVDPLAKQLIAGREGIKFTGWKAFDHGVNINAPTYVGGVAQWLDYRSYETTQKFTYVNLPGMETGECAKGSCFYIGTERLDVTAPDMLEKALEYIRKGYEKLMEETNGS